MNESNFPNRSFLNPDCTITGRSVVIEPESPVTGTGDLWPYSLSEYLKNFIGKTVMVKYSTDYGRLCEKKGILKTVGNDFISLLLYSNSLFILGSSLIKCVYVL